MRVALLALVAIACIGCKDDAKPAPTRTPAAGSGDAQVAIDGRSGPILDLVSCAPAPMPPGEPYPPLGTGHSRAPVHPAGGMGISSMPHGGSGSGSVARVTLGATKENGLTGAGAVLRKHENRLRFCYEQNLGRNPTLKGSSKLAIILEPGRGHPHEVIVQDKIDDELSLCMKHIVMELEFPAPAKTRVTVEQPVSFDWNPGVQGEPAIPTGWIPYARTSTLVPTEPAVVASVALQKAMPTAKLAACLKPQHTGAMRAIVRIGTDGTVFDASVGGLGDRDADLCMQAALVGTKTADPLPLAAEVACDFVRGDPAPWRVDPSSYSADTVLVTLEPTADAKAVREQLSQAVRATAYVVALHDDATKPPLFLLAGRGYGVVPDPAAPLTLDAREPLRICNGLLGEPASAPFADAEKLLATAALRCTHRPCPTSLTISIAATRTADQLATLVAAGRRAGFERIRLGDGACPP